MFSEHLQIAAQNIDSQLPAFNHHAIPLQEQV
jgi:hypothetical protein